MTPSVKDRKSDWCYVVAVFIANFTVALSVKAWGVLYLVLFERFDQTSTITSLPRSISQIVIGISGKSIYYGKGSSATTGEGWSATKILA